MHASVAALVTARVEKCICDGIDPFGGICSQIAQLASLAISHRYDLDDYLKRRRQHGNKAFAQTKANQKNMSEKEKALREWYHSGREMITSILARTLKVEIGNRYLSVAIISFLGMKVGFDLRDDVLVGVAMASFSVIMSMNGWHASASGKLGAEQAVPTSPCERT